MASVAEEVKESHELSVLIPKTAGTAEKINRPDPAELTESYLPGEAAVDTSKSGVYVVNCDDPDGESETTAAQADCCTKKIARVQMICSSWYTRKRLVIRYIIYGIVLALWISYVAYAMYYNFGSGFDSKNEAAVLLMALNIAAAVCFCYWALKRWLGERACKTFIRPLLARFTKVFKVTKKRQRAAIWVGAVIVAGIILVILVLDVGVRSPENLYSCAGLLVYVALCLVFSTNPARVRWRPVLLGLVLQFVFAYMILRSCWGYAILNWMGHRVEEFLGHTNAGSKFVFGDKYEDHAIAFKVLPIVIFFSTMISVLYHLGWMQVLIQKIAWVMQLVMGTTAGESLCAAANIFVGMSEAPLIIKPLLHDMTRSELHAVMTSGFATIAGSVMAIYIGFQIPANHLLSASLMSAPAALAASKLLYPETRISKTTSKDVNKIPKGSEKSLLDAASAGASVAVSLVANIAANLIAFVAVKQFLNETLKWFGARVGLSPPSYPDFTFEFICSYLFWPLAWIMGSDAGDCREIATLLGVKIFTNEFVAYLGLSELINNRVKLESYQTSNNITLGFDDIRNCYLIPSNTTSECLNMISERSEVIAVYALCGFANFGSIGIVIGALSTLAPGKRTDVVAIVLRAMIAGNVACFMTASIAGLLVVPGAQQTC